jgi:hypothetical protein
VYRIPVLHCVEIARISDTLSTELPISEHALDRLIGDPWVRWDRDRELAANCKNASDFRTGSSQILDVRQNTRHYNAIEVLGFERKGLGSACYNIHGNPRWRLIEGNGGTGIKDSEFASRRQAVIGEVLPRSDSDLENAGWILVVPK